jgi:hypothetical protein
MMQCQDPFVKNLKDKGYDLVAYPKTSIKLLNIYEHTINNKIKRVFIKSDARPSSGFLKLLFTDNVSGAIGVSNGRGIDIELRKTGKVETKIATKILGNYFNDTPSFDIALDNSETVVFHIEDITTTDADEIGLRNWLNNNQNELIPLFVEDIRKGNYFIATSLLKAKRVKMQIERLNKTSVGVDMNKIDKIPINGNLKFQLENSNNDQLIFNSEDEGIIFGVKLVRLTFSPKGILTIDNKQDFYRILGENLDLKYLSSSHDLNFIEID